jgi:MoaA/NifB/PqqE/SkfB family radical SAM enzyme
MGDIRVCCYNNNFTLGRYPETSIIDAWNNPKKQSFIEKLTDGTFPRGCELCEIQTRQKNYSNSLYSSFDQYENIIDKNWPVVLNFDFGTICNFECIMCGGKWSSSIRKNRENLPPLVSPYDQNFISQISEFLPHAKYINFLGGEPFLNPIYYKILTILLIKNKYVNGSITTNGSIFNNKIKLFLSNLPNLDINISLDSLERKTYEYIRKNGNYDTLIENIKKFKDMGKLNGIAICPMIQNIYEIPDLIKFAVDNNLRLSINTVFNHLGGKIKGIHENEDNNTKVWKGLINEHDEIPKNIKIKELIPEVSLFTLPKEKLKEIISYLNKFSFISNSYDNYQKKYKDFIVSLENHLETSKA